MMINSWGFSIFSPGISDRVDNPTEADLTAEIYQEVYERYLDLWTASEGFGFDGLAFAEHHFSPGNLSPSTHLLVAAVAARTKKIRFTTLGSVLPLHDARRYVEEVGMLDYLTGGRFEPGIAPGAGDAEAVRAGIPSDEIRPRYYSGAEVLAKAIAGPEVTHHDDFYDLEKVPIVPRMRETTGRSVWVTVMSPDSAAWSAARGYKICTAWMPMPAVSALGARYREAADAAGRVTSPSMLGLRRRVFVAETDRAAQEKYEDVVDYVANLAKANGFETADSAIRQMMMHPDDYAIGSPETVTEKLVDQCRAGGYGSLMFFTDFAKFSYEDLLRSHQLIGSRVAPVLHTVNVEAATGASR